MAPQPPSRHERQRAVRDLKVTRIVARAVDEIRRAAKSGDPAMLYAVLTHFFGELADEYQGEIASLQTAVDVLKVQLRRMRSGGRDSEPSPAVPSETWPPTDDESPSSP